MSIVEILPEEAVISEPFQEVGGVYWFSYEGLSVRDLTCAMNAVQARFVTITAYQLPNDEGFRLEYHWDLAGRLLGFQFHITGKEIESIYDLSEAVDWIEREVHEEYGIVFTGREHEPLLLRNGDTLGVNMRDEAPARPASAAKAQEVSK